MQFTKAFDFHRLKMAEIGLGKHLKQRITFDA